jgi:hypothetical protein
MFKWKISLIWSRGNGNKFSQSFHIISLFDIHRDVIIRMIQFVFTIFMIRFGYFELLHYNVQAFLDINYQNEIPNTHTMHPSLLSNCNRYEIKW